MKTKTVKIHTTKERFFKHYLSIVKAFPPFNKLRNQELEVFNELLLMNESLKDIDYKQRWKLIFHYDNKELMKTNLDMNTANFNNILTLLRKKNMIVNNQIPEKYLINASDLVLNIAFKVESGDK